MDQESKCDFEFIQVRIPGKLYEEKLVHLASALLAIVENLPEQAQDHGQDQGSDQRLEAA